MNPCKQGNVLVMTNALMLTEDDTSNMYDRFVVLKGATIQTEISWQILQNAGLIF